MPRKAKKPPVVVEQPPQLPLPSDQIIPPVDSKVGDLLHPGRSPADYLPHPSLGTATKPVITPNGLKIETF